MIRKLLLLTVALAGLGFVAPMPSPTEIRAWQSTVARRYNRDALLTFLKETLRAQKSYEGIDLSALKPSDHWTAAGRSLRSGGWEFYTANPAKDEFTLSYMLSDESEALCLSCQRDGSRRFRLLRIELSEVVHVDA